MILGLIDLCRASENQSSIEAIANDGTLLHHLSQARTKEWAKGESMAGMLFLSLNLCTFDPPAIREAARGTSVLRGVLQTPADFPSVVAQEEDWLVRHRTVSFDLLQRQLDADSLIEPWVRIQIVGLFNHDALDISVEQLIESFQTIGGALSQEQFNSLLAHRIERSDDLEALIVATKDAQIALAVFEASKTEPTLSSGAPAVREWSLGIIHDTDQDAWSWELGSNSGGPILELSLALVDSGQSPHASGHLDEALRRHAEKLVAGDDVWTPTGEDFCKITTLLSLPTQKALAGNIISSLESKDGDIPAAFFDTYGRFLDEHSDSRTHKVLPNVVARLVARDNWYGVMWFLNLANSHSEAQDEVGREPEFAYLREKVVDKTREYEDATAPPALKELCVLLRVEPNFALPPSDPQEP